jgi:hypothetical protein
MVGTLAGKDERFGCAAGVDRGKRTLVAKSHLRRSLLACVASAILLVGCGQSPEDAVRETVEDFYAALSNGNGDRACSLLVDDVRKSLSVEGVADCGDVIARTSGESGWDGPPKIATIGVDGDSASVALEQGAKAGRATLRRIGDEWRIVDF